MKNLLKIFSGHLFSEILRITLLKFNFFLTAGIIFFQIKNLMLTLNLKLCVTVSRGGMVYEKPFKDILWSLIFRNIANYVTEIQFFSDGWNHFFPNQEFNADIEPEVVCYS